MAEIEEEVSAVTKLLGAVKGGLGKVGKSANLARRIPGYRTGAGNPGMRDVIGPRISEVLERRGPGMGRARRRYAKGLKAFEANGPSAISTTVPGVLGLAERQRGILHGSWNGGKAVVSAGGTIGAPMARGAGRLGAKTAGMMGGKNLKYTMGAAVLLGAHAAHPLRGQIFHNPHTQGSTGLYDYPNHTMDDRRVRPQSTAQLDGPPGDIVFGLYNMRA